MALRGGTWRPEWRAPVIRRPTRRQKVRETQQPLFDDNGSSDVADIEVASDVGELERDVHRMTLETSSGVYARRRAEW